MRSGQPERWGLDSPVGAEGCSGRDCSQVGRIVAGEGTGWIGLGSHRIRRGSLEVEESH